MTKIAQSARDVVYAHHDQATGCVTLKQLTLTTGESVTIYLALTEVQELYDFTFPKCPDCEARKIARPRRR